MLVDVVVSILWMGVLAYSLFGGADFGSGVWDLLAGSASKGAAARKRIDRSIGPVWEANHVWLIFVFVFLWTAFPAAFAALMTALFIPFILAGVGIIFRGGAFVFRKSSSSFAQARFFGVLFSVSSVITPFFFGVVAGTVASGRVPINGDVDPWTVWINPTAMLGGVLAVGTCAWLAAVFLAADSHRDGEPVLAEAFSRRALVTGGLIGVVSLVGILVLEQDAPTLANGLEGWASLLVVLSAAGGLGAMWQLRSGRPVAARIPAAIAVAAIVIGWGVGQYPWILVDETELADAAGVDVTLWALVVTFVLAGLTVIPSLVYMLRLTNRGDLSTDVTRSDSSLARLQEMSR